ncbi:tRNA uracil 4-sulfurtransferase ThiI [Thiomicrorhabdus aquaedulcis]|uniref:tRNA uracil 4-sulfurtransferase ThiI n=1 Tax=Thiomicrorhabdus aquaedulcis TaxID=2211106 RepID=UPI001E463885|nr:tRNA uracil 4-sulfurtransferase ThiI [Thiomicrorhabdus aquaedulcis]
MILRLSDNLRVLLRRIDADVVVTHFWDKIEVHTAEPFVTKVREVLKQTPGIEQVLEVVQYDTGVDFLTIAQKVAVHAVPLIAGKTFVVRVKRTGNHLFSSCDLQRFVGEYLLMVGTPKAVDLHLPEVKVQFELHQDVINVITDRYPGLGGYPMGGQGDVLSLMSGGFDSTIASYMTMKRGIKTHFVFFNLGGAAHELGVKQVALYLWGQFGASHRVSFVTVPFEDVVAEIFRSTHESYMGVILKRLMLSASEQIADQMGIEALVTGESVAQVSSQTLRNLAVIDAVTTKLVLRPLATFNKVDIMAMADAIGTRQFAQSMPEYCGVISKTQSLMPRLSA